VQVFNKLLKFVPNVLLRGMRN